ncbi:MAG: hypothetical protein ACKO5Y_04870, partial [Bacteroidota bacterium]
TACFNAIRTSTSITISSESVIESAYIFDLSGKQLAKATTPNNVFSLQINSSLPVVIQLKINNRWYSMVK